MLCVAEQKQTLIDAKRSENHSKKRLRRTKSEQIIRIMYLKRLPLVYA